MPLHSVQACNAFHGQVELHSTRGRVSKGMLQGDGKTLSRVGVKVSIRMRQRRLESCDDAVVKRLVVVKRAKFTLQHADKVAVPRVARQIFTA